jgi:hypothetical protein
MKKDVIILSSHPESLIKVKNALWIILLFTLPVNFNCNGKDPITKNSDPPDVAIAWMKMHTRIIAATADILPPEMIRSNAYLGLTLYESIAPGIADHQSIAPQLSSGLTVPAIQQGSTYYWPASANAALALMSKSLYAYTTPALLKAIDSLEAVFYKRFQADIPSDEVELSANFGKIIARAIFEWSKTDGGKDVHKKVFSDTYVPPTGPGMWVATGEFPFSQPVYPYWGNNRTFIPGLSETTQPPPPPAYSEVLGSDFYNAANEVYTISQNLTHEDSMMAKSWEEMPVDPIESEYDAPSEVNNMIIQLVLLKKLSLQATAVLCCKHGIAGNDALISCLKTKYKYNLVRPITYIRNVLKHPDWNPLVPTPPHPEYSSGHAVYDAALAVVLENEFGKIPFTYHTYYEEYVQRNYQSFEEYASEVAWSRVLGGIHYRFSADAGLKQGRKVGELVNTLKFRR